MDELTIYYTLVSITYVVFVVALVGLVWLYLLSTARTRLNIVKMKHNNPFSYWILNISSWFIILYFGLSLYFFTEWYVLNDEAKTKGVLYK